MRSAVANVAAAFPSAFPPSTTTPIAGLAPSVPAVGGPATSSAASNAAGSRPVPLRAMSTPPATLVPAAGKSARPGAIVVPSPSGGSVGSKELYKSGKGTPSRRQQMLASIGTPTGSSTGRVDVSQLGDMTTKNKEELRKWRESVKQEGASSMFSSPVLEYEFTLRRAQMFGEGGVPSLIAAAVAFQSMQDLASTKGNAYAPILLNLRDIFTEAVFIPEDAARLKAALPEGETVPSDEVLELFMRGERFSSKLRSVELVVEEYDEQIAALRKQIADITEATDARYEAEVAARVEMEEKVKRAEEHFKFMAQQVRKAQEDTEQYKGLNSVSTILAIFDGCTEVEQKTITLDLIEAMGPKVKEILAELLVVQPPGALSHLCFDALVASRKVISDHIRDLIQQLLDCPKLVKPKGVRGKILCGILHNVGDKDRQVVLETALEMVEDAEWHAIHRYLSGFEETHPLRVDEAEEDDGALGGAGGKKKKKKKRKTAAKRAAPPEALVSYGGADNETERRNLVMATTRALSSATREGLTADSLREAETPTIEGFAGPAFAGLAEQTRLVTLQKLIQHLTDDEKRQLAQLEFADMLAPEPEPEPEPDAGAEEVKEELEPEPPKPVFTSPLTKYMLKPGRGIKAQQIKVPAVQLLVYDILEKKIVADETEFRESGTRQALPLFVRDFLITKYGLPSLCDGYLYSMVKLIVKNIKNRRLWLFGVMCGIVEQERYDPRLCNIVLRLYNKCFNDKFSAVVLRTRRIGACIAPLPTVTAALEAVFPETRIAFKLDRMQLTHGRRHRLLETVTAAAVPYKDKIPEGDWEDTWAKDTIVVDVDDLMKLVVETFWEQQDDDSRRIEVMYHEYDEDGNGVLTYDEFRKIAAALAVEPMSEPKTLKLFNEVSMLDAAVDFVSPAAFAHLCMVHGLTAPVHDHKTAARVTSAAMAFANAFG